MRHKIISENSTPVVILGILKGHSRSALNKSKNEFDRKIFISSSKSLNLTDPQSSFNSIYNDI